MFLLQHRYKMFSMKKKGNKFTVIQKIIPRVHRSNSSPMMGAKQGETPRVFWGGDGYPGELCGGCQGAAFPLHPTTHTGAMLSPVPAHSTLEPSSFGAAGWKGAGAGMELLNTTGRGLGSLRRQGLSLALEMGFGEGRGRKRKRKDGEKESRERGRKKGKGEGRRGKKGKEGERR